MFHKFYSDSKEYIYMFYQWVPRKQINVIIIWNISSTFTIVGLIYITRFHWSRKGISYSAKKCISSWIKWQREWVHCIWSNVGYCTRRREELGMWGSLSQETWWGGRSLILNLCQVLRDKSFLGQIMTNLNKTVYKGTQ